MSLEIQMAAGKLVREPRVIREDLICMSAGFARLIEKLEPANPLRELLQFAVTATHAAAYGSDAYRGQQACVLYGRFAHHLGVTLLGTVDMPFRRVCKFWSEC